MRKSLIITLSVIAIMLLIVMNIISKDFKPSKVKYEKWVKIDSVKVIEPGELHTLQFDNMYHVFTEDGYNFKTRVRRKKGDSILYIFYQK